MDYDNGYTFMSDAYKECDCGHNRLEHFLGSKDCQHEGCYCQTFGNFFEELENGDYDDFDVEAYIESLLNTEDY